MKAKTYQYTWCYRSPRTTQERRMVDKYQGYVRAKRGKRGLPNSYDDIQIGKKQKSWKMRRKTQYRCGKRGKRREVFLPILVCEHTIAKYLEHIDIPYFIERIRKGYYYKAHWDNGKIKHGSKDVGSKLVYWSDKKVLFPEEAYRFKWIWRSYIFREIVIEEKDDELDQIN